MVHEILKEFRVKKGYTVQAMADYLSTSTATCRALEKNPRHLSTMLLSQWLSFLDVTEKERAFLSARAAVEQVLIALDEIGIECDDVIAEYLIRANSLTRESRLRVRDAVTHEVRALIPDITYSIESIVREVSESVGGD